MVCEPSASGPVFSVTEEPEQGGAHGAGLPSSRRFDAAAGSLKSRTTELALATMLPFAGFDEVSTGMKLSIRTPGAVPCSCCRPHRERLRAGHACRRGAVVLNPTPYGAEPSLPIVVQLDAPAGLCNATTFASAGPCSRSARTVPRRRSPRGSLSVTPGAVESTDLDHAGGELVAGRVGDDRLEVVRALVGAVVSHVA